MITEITITPNRLTITTDKGRQTHYFAESMAKCMDMARPYIEQQEREQREKIDTTRRR